MNSDSIDLVQEVYAPLNTTGTPLTVAQFDNNNIAIYQDLESLQTTIGVDAYDSGTTYTNDYTDPTTEHFATYGSRFWMWVNAVPSSGVSPVAGADWQEVPPTMIAHEKNKDAHLTPVSLDYADAVPLATGGELVKGAPYQIADKGISIQASTEETFCTAGCRVMRIVKNTYYTVSGINLGVWKSTLTPSALDVVVWGGKVWLNVTGLVGSASDDTSLDANWGEVPTTNNTYYEDKSFFILYDFVNDWVSRQFDDRGNSFGIPYDVGASFNPVDICDWGNSLMIQNQSWGIYNNATTGSIYSNTTIGYISKNTNSGDISRNTIIGDISSNSNGGDIFGNSCSGSILLNSNGGQIYKNSNSEDISFNSNTGVIASNSNSGSIGGIGSANNDIINNINNGDITTTTTGDISDTIVNK
jgi:hypothetical protein